MSKPSLKSEYLNVFKHCIALVPLTPPDIQSNPIKFAQNFRYNLDLLPQFILPTLGNIDSLKYN